jgi:signal transduction histidine kinase
MLINEFNIPTSFIIIGFLYLIVPIMTWIVLNGQRSSLVSLWCGGGLFMGCALLLIGLRGSIPDWATYTLANLLLFTGYLFRIQCLRLYLAVPAWQTSSMVFVSLVFILAFQVIHSGIDEALLRLKFVTTYNAVMNLTIAVMAWRIGRRYESSNAYFIFVIYLLMSFVLLGRIVELFKGNVAPDTMVASIMTVQIGIVGVLSSVATHFGYIGMTLDRLIRNETKITTDKLAVIGHSQQVIAHLDRQRSLGVMSASLGHELNQPLAAILANAQIAKKGIDNSLLKPHQLQDIMDKIIHNTRRASLIIERIRGFIRPATLEIGPVKFGRLVRDTAKYIKEDAMIHEIDIVFNVDDGALLVKGDAIQLSQVLLNIYRNAIEVLQHEKQRRLTISVKHIENSIVTTISDTGPGFSEEALKHVGESFYTTKAEGLGLGLSISKSIIAQHGGEFFILNSESGGACFKVCLPALYHQSR